MDSHERLKASILKSQHKIEVLEQRLSNPALPPDAQAQLRAKRDELLKVLEVLQQELDLKK